MLGWKQSPTLRASPSSICHHVRQHSPHIGSTAQPIKKGLRHLFRFGGQFLSSKILLIASLMFSRLKSRLNEGGVEENVPAWAQPPLILSRCTHTCTHTHTPSLNLTTITNLYVGLVPIFLPLGTKGSLPTKAYFSLSGTRISLLQAYSTLVSPPLQSCMTNGLPPQRNSLVDLQPMTVFPLVFSPGASHHHGMTCFQDWSPSEPLLSPWSPLLSSQCRATSNGVGMYGFCSSKGGPKGLPSFKKFCSVVASSAKMWPDPIANSSEFHLGWKSQMASLKLKSTISLSQIISMAPQGLRLKSKLLGNQTRNHAHFPYLLLHST